MYLLDLNSLGCTFLVRSLASGVFVAKLTHEY